MLNEKWQQYMKADQYIELYYNPAARLFQCIFADYSNIINRQIKI